MSSLNRSTAQSRSFAAFYGTERNHHALPVRALSPEAKLTRLTMAHMLWEKQFYMDGQSSVGIMNDLVAQVNPTFVGNLAKVAREQYKLRHVPLVLLRSLAKAGKLQAQVLANVIQRPDEMSEFLSIYWNKTEQVPNPHYGAGGNFFLVTDVKSKTLPKSVFKKEPISNQVKKGLALAFAKFNEFQLAKWDKNSAEISLRDVMFLTHPKPANLEQELLFKKVANRALATPDTWETELSGGADKRETFERLMAEGKLGALAFLRNLRNMRDVGISDSVIRKYGAKVNTERVLPFRFIAAARIVPQFEDMLEQMMFKCLEGHEKLPGKTLLLVDCSGSMFGTKVSAKSDLDRFDAAAALAVLCREVCESVEIFGFANDAVRVAPRRGFALIEAIRASTSGGTRIGQSLNTATRAVGNYDRVIIFTDEQSSDQVSSPSSGAKGYLLNVASYENGLNHGAWTTISGFSEASLDFIQMLEKNSD
jgi:hypothetical protein